MSNDYTYLAPDVKLKDFRNALSKYRETQNSEEFCKLLDAYWNILDVRYFKYLDSACERMKGKNYAVLMMEISTFTSALCTLIEILYQSRYGVPPGGNVRSHFVYLDFFLRSEGCINSKGDKKKLIIQNFRELPEGEGTHGFVDGLVRRIATCTIDYSSCDKKDCHTEILKIIPGAENLDEEDKEKIYYAVKLSYYFVDKIRNQLIHHGETLTGFDLIGYPKIPRWLLDGKPEFDKQSGRPDIEDVFKTEVVAYLRSDKPTVDDPWVLNSFQLYSLVKKCYIKYKTELENGDDKLRKNFINKIDKIGS